MMDPITVFERMFDKLWVAMQDYMLNYVFGIAAMVFGIRAISQFITNGKVSVLSIVLALIFGGMAVTLGQDIWVDLIDLIKSSFK